MLPDCIVLFFQKYGNMMCRKEEKIQFKIHVAMQFVFPALLFLNLLVRTRNSPKLNDIKVKADITIK